MGHVEKIESSIVRILDQLKTEQAAFNRTPRTGGRNNLFARQSQELAERVNVTQERLARAETSLAAARLIPEEIIIQEEPILDVPIQERFNGITPSIDTQDNTLRNALIVGGIIALLVL